MNKVKLLYLLIGILTLLNVAVISYLLLQHKRPPHQMGKKEDADLFIKERFGFDEAQMKLFTTSKEKHQKTSRTLEEKLHQVSKEYYQIGKNQNKDSLLNLVSQYTTQIYQTNSEHFKEVEAICNADQKAALQPFVNSLIDRGGKRERRPDHKRPH